jgi:hypothetical protein
MRVAQAEVFVHFEVELDEELAAVLQGGDVVNGQAHTLGYRADGFEEVFALRSAGLGVNHDVGWNDFADALFDGIAEGVNLLEAGSARNANGGIDEVAIASATDANAVNVQDAIHAAHGHGDFLLQSFWGDIQKGVEGSPAEL